MAQEIERKFLVTGEFKSLVFAQSRIVQGYISSARGRTVRVRIRAVSYTHLTLPTILRV